MIPSWNNAAEVMWKQSSYFHTRPGGTSLTGRKQRFPVVLTLIRLWRLTYSCFYASRGQLKKYDGFSL